jgi:hypothetical protein
VVERGVYAPGIKFLNRSDGIGGLVTRHET